MKKCNCVNTDFDQSNFEHHPYEDAKALIAYDDCYNAIYVDAPDLLTDEQKEKLEVIKTDGNGDKYLSDDGTYKEIQSGGGEGYLPLTAGPDNGLTGSLYLSNNGSQMNGILPTSTNTNSYVGLTANPINQANFNIARLGELSTISSASYNRLISSCHIIPRGDQNYSLGINDQPWYNVFAMQHYVRCVIAFDPDNTGDKVVDLMSTIKLKQDAQIISTGDIPLIPAEGSVVKLGGNIELKEGINLLTENLLFQLPSNFFNPINNVIEGITLEQLNTYAHLYSLKMFPVANDQDVVTFRATRLVINDAVAYFDYYFTKINGNTVERYEISVTGTGAAVNTLKCEKVSYQIDALPIQFYLPYGNGTPVTVPISDSGIQLNITYKDAGSCGATISAPNGDVEILNAYRSSLYNGTPEGQTLSSQTISTTPVNVDDTIYTSFNDEVKLRIMKTGNYYEIKFIVGNGFVIGESKKIHV